MLADRNALKVIVRNLFENTLRHAQATPARARIAIASEPTTVTVSFADQGRGFSGDPLQLGTLFFRGERSQGAGVGLYLIRMLMRRMGGRRCAIKSRAGCRIRDAADFPPRGGAGVSSAARILVVEDEPNVGRTLTERLTR